MFSPASSWQSSSALTAATVSDDRDRRYFSTSRRNFCDDDSDFLTDDRPYEYTLPVWFGRADLQ